MMKLYLQMFGGGGSKSSTKGGKAKARKKAPKTAPRRASDTNDLAELTQYMQDKYSVSVRGVEKVPFEIVQRAAQGYEDLNAEYNHEIVMTEINGDENGKHTYASASRYRHYIQFNPDMFSSVEKVRESYANDVKSGFHPAGTTYENIMDHEIAHVLAGRLYAKAYRPGSAEYYRALDGRTLEKNIVSEACRNAKKAAKQAGIARRLTNDELIAQISRYATTNRSETIAEAVADYKANGERANLLSVEIHKILKREMEK